MKVKAIFVMPEQWVQVGSVEMGMIGVMWKVKSVEKISSYKVRFDFYNGKSWEVGNQKEMKVSG
jgi:hypothetical protein